MRRERNSFIGLRNCVSVMYVVLTVKIENSNFLRAFTYAIILRTWSQHICDIYEIPRNFELKEFFLKLYKTTYYEYKILTDAQKFRKIKKRINFLFFFFWSFWLETILTNFDFTKNFDFILTYKLYQKQLLSN